MKRIEWEKITVQHMIELWCLNKHEKQELCEECRELLIYATARLDRCKFGDRKTKCHKCPVHCYRPDMREKIREVMRVQRSENDVISSIGGVALYFVKIKATDIILLLTNLLTLGERNHNNNHNENSIFGYLHL